MSYHDPKTINYLAKFNNITKRIRKYCASCNALIQSDTGFNKLVRSVNHSGKNAKCYNCGIVDARIIEREDIISTMRGPVVEKPDWSKYPPMVLNPGEIFEGQDPSKNRLSRKNDAN